MAKVRILSRKFMAGHPKAGEPTFFVEKFLTCIGKEFLEENYLQELCLLNAKSIADGDIYLAELRDFQDSLKSIAEEKGHTVRAGQHFKVGDFISIRVWSGKPYASKQIIIAPDIEIKKILDIEISINRTWFDIHINGKQLESTKWETLAMNDGLQLNDFFNWFPKSFDGQILCWSDSIEY